jgi:hypothetical protein
MPLNQTQRELLHDVLYAAIRAAADAKLVPYVERCIVPHSVCTELL